MGDRRTGMLTMTGRLLLRYLPALVLILLVSGVVLDHVLENGMARDVDTALEINARAIRRALPEGSATQAQVQSLGRELGLRITLIGTDGTVLADSAGDPAAMANHANRPEVRAALRGSTGASTRVSATLDEPYRYIALPPENGAGVLVRVARPLSQLQSRLARARATIVGAFSLALLLGVMALVAVSRSLSRPLEEMTAAVSRMTSGDLAARAPGRGGAEAAVLADAFNHMADELGRRLQQFRGDRERLGLILSAMEEGVLLVDPQETVEYTNLSARVLLGHEPQNLGTIVPQTLRHIVEGARDAGSPREEEIEIGQPLRVVRASAIPVGSPASENHGGTVLLVLRDVTEARRVEAMRHDFVANASHELKTPVAAIRAAAETIRQAVHDDPEGARRFADRLLGDATRLSRIVGDLLDLSRLEAERPPRDRVRLDLVAAEEAERFMFPAEAANLHLEVLTETPVAVLGSASSLALLVRNLLDNAIRYTRPSGHINVSVARRGSDAVLEVRDTGMGIPSRHLPRIFERFYRVDPARSRETGGTGLGLAIVKHVAEQLEGRVEADSELGRGSTFRVVLPLAPSAARPSRSRKAGHTS
jgi:two-component system, OmpR family, phosphate regulon sensor histidine kinase PhoR